MSLKVEIQWKKFGGGRSEICNWLYLVLYSRPVKKKEKKKQSDGALCFNACLLSCIFYTHGLNLREKPKVLYLSFARIKISFNLKV